MFTELTDSDSKTQSKIDRISSFILSCIRPSVEVEQICSELGYQYRDRVYNPMVTVWLFICQVLSKDHSCQQTLNRFLAHRAAKGLSRVASNTTAYCKARSRLPEQLFERLMHWSAEKCQEVVDENWLFHGRGVDIVDGWTLLMADTKENQQEYPQQKSQRPGCGFPIMRMIGVFSLATGVVRESAFASYQGKQTGETSLLRSILHCIFPGRILLADRYYATFWLLASGMKRNIDVVARAHHLRIVDFRRGRKLGSLDQIVSYQRPARPAWMSQSEYDSYPSSISVRHIKYKVPRQGFRTREVVVATTLLDASEYPVAELAELYRRRWEVELHIRSLKTHMQMEHLRCKCPQMVRKEIYCHLIGYNLIRAAMIASALRYKWKPTRLSFTNAMQALEDFASSVRLQSSRLKDQWNALLQTIADRKVGARPGRQEKRVIKKRPKSFKLMQVPRNPNRNRYATMGYA